MKKIIIVTGFPASGKTSIAKRISEDFDIPLISKDEIKEMLFDNIGWNDRNWSEKLGKISIKLMYYCLDNLLKTNASCVIETHFNIDLATKDFNKLIEKYKFSPLQINCSANKTTLINRFKERNLKDRHPGHVDHENYDAMFNNLPEDGLQPSLKIPGEIIKINTNNFNDNLFNEIHKEVKKYLLR